MSSNDTTAPVKAKRVVRFPANGPRPSKTSRPRIEVKFHQLKIPKTLIERIDKLLETDLLGTPRNAWLVQAALERLEREEAKAGLKEKNAR